MELVGRILWDGISEKIHPAQYIWTEHGYDAMFDALYSRLWKK